MTVDDIVNVAMQIEVEDPIDWGLLNVNEKDAYKLVGYSILDMYNEWNASDNKEEIMLSTITKLVVENFVLNLKLVQTKIKVT